MKFDLLSDLHVDVWGDNYRLDYRSLKKNRIAVVPGDVSDDVEETIAELKKMAKVWEHVVFVEGNHEHHGNFDDLTRVRTRLAEALRDEPNIHYLHDAPVVIDGVGFAGRCGWWTYRFAEPLVSEAECRHAYGEGRGRGSDIIDVIVATARRDYLELSEDVRHLDQRGDVETIVLLTHTLPHKSGLSIGVYPGDRKFAGAYGNEDMALIAAAPEGRKIANWVFGHNHDAKDFVEGHIHYISNPRGRPKDFNREQYDVRVVEVVPPGKGPANRPHHRRERAKAPQPA